MANYAYGFSEHPDKGAAIGEAVGQVQEALNGELPKLVVFFVSGTHVGAFVDMAKSVRTLLSPQNFIGGTSSSVIACTRHVESGPGLSIWATDMSDTEIFAFPYAFGDEISLKDLPASGSLLLLSDPRSFPIEDFLCAVEKRDSSVEASSGLEVIGGLLSANANLLAANQVIQEGGAAGIYFPEGSNLFKIISIAHKPIGQPYTITGVDGLKVTGMGGQPPMERLAQIFTKLTDSEREHLRRNLDLGVAVRQNKATLEQGDFLVRPIRNLHRTGEIEVGMNLNVGDLVQFQTLDPEATSKNLKSLLQNQVIESALMFTCTGRSSMFGGSDYESDLVHNSLTEKCKTMNLPLVGISCAGEIGPIAGQNFLHSFATSLVLFK